NIRKELVQKKWNDQELIFRNHVRILRENLEKDKRLRGIEAHKKEKEQEFLEASKLSEIEKPKEEQIKAAQDKFLKEREDEKFQQEIDVLVSDTEKKIREYEFAIRKGEFEKEAPYQEVIEIYNDIKKKLEKKGWRHQSIIYADNIKILEEKRENDKRLREIELQKQQKQKEYEKLVKTRKSDKILEADLERMQQIEDQYKKELEEEEFENRIMSLANRASEIVRKYELEIRKGNFEQECRYPDAIKIYEDIQNMLIDKGWDNEARIYSSSIKVLKEKWEKDRKLRELETQKEIKAREMEEMLKAPKMTPSLDKAQIREAEKGEEKALVDEGFTLIDKAEKLVKDYELKLKFEKNILEHESPYEEAISLYRQARVIFQDQGWDNEANSMINTINFYNEKLSKDQKLRDFERRKLEEAKLEKEPITFAPLIDKKLVEKQKRAMELVKQKKEQEKYSNEAFRLIDEAEKRIKNYELKIKDGTFPDSPFKQVIDMYREARKMFEEIGWDDQAISLINTINFYKEKMEADNKLRNLEKKKIEEQKKEMIEQQRIIEEYKRKQEEKLKQQAEELRLKQKEEIIFEERKQEAFKLMDQAKRELNNDNFDKAIELYNKSEKIFSEVNWFEGLKMVQESIIVIKKKKQDFELIQKAIKEEKEEKIRLEKEIEAQIVKTKELERLQQQLKREEMIKIQKQKDKERKVSREAYNLLEEGTKLVEDKRFDKAYEKYTAAQDLFNEIEWFHEVNRISTDLLITLKNEEQEYNRYQELERKRMEDEKELKKMLYETELQRKELDKLSVKERRKKLLKLQVSEKLKEKIEENLERADIEIKNYNYNKGIVMFKETINMMEKVGWEREISEINKQIHILKNKSHVPLITIENFEEEENIDNFKSAYIALDKAHSSLLKNRLMKAISELNEATYNLEETKIGLKYIDEIQKKIIQFKGEIDKIKAKKDISDISGIELKEDKLPELSSELGFEYMDKCKKEERRNNFEKAIEYADIAKEIFIKLGSEWSNEIMRINRYINTLENKDIARKEAFKRKKVEIEQEEMILKEEEEDFKARLEARKEARRKRIEKLMKED
ncbi:MAG: hypothetical protein ACFFAO_09570, partial [Candidatus Hermodarchaeota archaeon]